MEYEQINRLGIKARHEINEGNFDAAYEIVKEIQNIDKGCYVDYTISGLLIDIGNIKGVKFIQTGISLIKKRLKEVKKNEIKKVMYYNLANAYFSIFLFESKENPAYHYLKKDTEIDKAIKYYNKSINLLTPTPEEYINLGNALLRTGQWIDALDLYEKALQIDENHSMALHNKAMTLYNHALLSEHPQTFLLESYQILKRCDEKKLVLEAKKSRPIYMEKIEDIFKNKKILNQKYKPIKYKKFSNKSLKNYLIEFSLKNQLYLNICNFCQRCENSIQDSIVIKKMIVPIENGNSENSVENDAYLRLSFYLNQIKQDFIAARYLIALSRYEENDLSFIEKDVIIVDVLNENNYNIYIQLLIMAFKSMYDILDKIAFFINDYLKLEIPEHKVSFDSIWSKKEKMIKTNNLSLSALFNMNQSLKKHNNRLNKVRNAVTHRFIQIRNSSNYENYEILTEEDLLNYTIELAKIVRNAVIYSINFVDFEEKKKNHTNGKNLFLKSYEIPLNDKRRTRGK